MKTSREIERQSEYFSAPLGAATSGRLIFTRGAGRLSIQTDSSMLDLYRIYFEGRLPAVETQDGQVKVTYPPFHLAYLLGRESADATLNGSIPWEIGIRGGVSRLEGELSGLQLHGLDIQGGASWIEVRLPYPYGTTSLLISGGVSNSVFMRPQGVAVRLEVNHGASRLAFDRQSYGSMGGMIRLETPDYSQAVDRYCIRISGGASNLTVGTY
jgi:hypothetical protein